MLIISIAACRTSGGEWLSALELNQSSMIVIHSDSWLAYGAICPVESWGIDSA